MITKITSLGQFIERLEDLEKNKKRFTEYYFRGHEDIAYVLQPSLFRSNKLIANEHKLFKEMILENPNEFTNDTTTLEKLVRLQHFGLPTRILDLTGNPLVSLFFACSNQTGNINQNVDGEIMVFQIPNKEVKYYDSDSVSILSNLCKLKKSEKIFDTTLDRKLFNNDNNDTGNGNVYKLLHAIREEKSYFSNVIDPKDINSIFCVKVKKNNRRILVQDGLFLIFGISNSGTLLEVNPNWLPLKTSKEKIFIDKNSKTGIIKELERINITVKSLFPDIEYSAKTIKKKYS